MMNTMKYPKILSIGDPLLHGLFDGRVIIEEKIDGSQFRVWFDENGEIHFGSKGVDYDYEKNTPDKMFLPAIAQAKKHFEGLPDPDRPQKNVLFIFEFLCSPKHNTLKYDRVPRDNLVLLDIYSPAGWWGYGAKWAIGARLGFEVAPLLFEGELKSVEDVKSLLEKESFLGGTKIEGFVVKNYEKYHTVPYRLGDPLMGKFVREEFKELNAKEWGDGIPLHRRLMETFPKEPRWVKVVQHLRESGELTNTPKDIGKLVAEVEKDFTEEAKPMLQELLWNEFKHSLTSEARRGFAEWYKQRLLEGAIK